MEHIINNRSEKYLLFPKDRIELEHIIKDEIDKHGYDADLNHIDVSNITDFSCLFCGSKFNGDISRWDVSNVTNMYHMFHKALKFNQDLSGWNVSKATNKIDMFAECPCPEEHQPRFK